MGAPTADGRRGSGGEGYPWGTAGAQAAAVCCSEARPKQRRMASRRGYAAGGLHLGSPRDLSVPTLQHRGGGQVYWRYHQGGSRPSFHLLFGYQAPGAPFPGVSPHRDNQATLSAPLQRLTRPSRSPLCRSTARCSSWVFCPFPALSMAARLPSSSAPRRAPAPGPLPQPRHLPGMLLPRTWLAKRPVPLLLAQQPPSQRGPGPSAGPGPQHSLTRSPLAPFLGTDHPPAEAG